MLLRRDIWIYLAAWIALAAIYSAALVAYGASLGLAVRNAVANLLLGAACPIFSPPDQMI